MVLKPHKHNNQHNNPPLGSLQADTPTSASILVPSLYHLIQFLSHQLQLYVFHGKWTILPLPSICPRFSSAAVF